MRLLFLILAIASSALAASDLVVTHARLWTPEGVRADQEIIASEGRIRAVGASGSLARPAGARVIDANGDTVLPGLIDAHAHLVLGTRTPQDVSPDFLPDTIAKQLLHSGVTTARIHLWDLPTARRLQPISRSDAFPSPRLVIGGPALFGGRPDWQSATGNVWGVKSAEDAVAKVGQLADAGVTWIALHDLGRFQPGELDAIVAEIRRRGLRILVGGDRLEEVERAIAIGADSVEYVDRTDAPYPPKLIEALKVAGTTIVPPLGFPHRFAAYRRGELALAPRHTEFFRAETAAAIATAWREGVTGEIQYPPQWLDKLPLVDAKFRALRAAGVRVVVGTDCGSPAHFPADAIWWELETWRQLGVPVNEIIAAATVLPGALLRQPDIGHLNPGARADFLLYRGDLADGPLTADRVRLVAKGGSIHLE